MPEDSNVHPGSFVGDSVEEFKKLPTWGKVVAGLLFVVVAYIGYSQYRSGKATSTSAAGTNTSGTSGGGGAMIGNVPVIPPGYQSVYNPTTGTLEGYQPVNTPTGGGTQPTGNPPLQGGNPPTNGQAFTNPLIPLGYKGLPNYSNLKPNTPFTYNGPNGSFSGTLFTGGGGRLYGTPTGFTQGTGHDVLLYGPPSQYHTVASPSILQAGGSNGATPLPNTRLM